MIYIILLIALWVWGVTPSTVILCGILSLLWHHGTPPTPPAERQTSDNVLGMSQWSIASIETIQTPHRDSVTFHNASKQSGVAEN